MKIPNVVKNSKNHTEIHALNAVRDIPGMSPLRRFLHIHQDYRSVGNPLCRRYGSCLRQSVQSRQPKKEYQAMTWIGWAIVVLSLLLAGRWLENKLERIELLLIDINDIVKDLDYLAERGREERLIKDEREMDRL